MNRHSGMFASFKTLTMICHLNWPRGQFELPGEGIEPSRGFPQGILSALRMPFRHPGPAPR